MLYHNEFYLFITFFIELVGLVLYNPVLYKMSRLFKFILKILRIGMYNLMLISMQQTYLFKFFWKRIYMIWGGVGDKNFILGESQNMYNHIFPNGQMQTLT